MVKWLRDPTLVGRTLPLMGAALFLWGYIGQIVRMWSERTAAGQSLTGWVVLWLALLCYWHFYRICCPRERVAIWSVAAELWVNAGVIATVLWFRGGG